MKISEGCILSNESNFMRGERFALSVLYLSLNAVMKRKDSNCVGILSHEVEAVTASNLSEYTVLGQPDR